MKIFVLLLVSILLLYSCEDPVPNDYEPEIFIQGYLYVGQPIKDLVVMETQPVLDSFNLDKALIKDASVIIRGDGREMVLEYNDDGDTLLSQAGYDYDPSYLVKPKTKYDLEVTLNDGRKFYGSTTTPENFSWVKQPNYYLNYPKDIIKLPSTDTIAWEPVNNTLYYLISIKVLDTLEYGKYLEIPQIDEKNSRIKKPWADDDYYKRSTVVLGLPTTRTPVVWNVFRWYGLHETTVYAPDPNYFQWYQQYILASETIDFLSSIENGIGVFGSASLIRDTSFIIKNQP